jgi:hypothetical protein
LLNVSGGHGIKLGRFVEIDGIRVERRSDGFLAGRPLRVLRLEGGDSRESAAIICQVSKVRPDSLG